MNLVELKRLDAAAAHAERTQGISRARYIAKALGQRYGSGVKFADGHSAVIPPGRFQHLAQKEL